MKRAKFYLTMFVMVLVTMISNQVVQSQRVSIFNDTSLTKKTKQKMFLILIY